MGSATIHAGALLQLLLRTRQLSYRSRSNANLRWVADVLAGKNIEQQNNMGTGDGTKRRIGRWADFPGFGENSWAKAEEDGGWGKKSTRRSFFFFLKFERRLSDTRPSQRDCRVLLLGETGGELLTLLGLAVPSSQDCALCAYILDCGPTLPLGPSRVRMGVPREQIATFRDNKPERKQRKQSRNPAQLVHCIIGYLCTFFEILSQLYGLVHRGVN